MSTPLHQSDTDAPVHGVTDAGTEFEGRRADAEQDEGKRLRNGIISLVVLVILVGALLLAVPGLRDVAPWFDLNTAQQPLFDLGSGESLTGEEWANLASATSIWVILPFVLGLVRVMRAELK